MLDLRQIYIVTLPWLGFTSLFLTYRTRFICLCFHCLVLYEHACCIIV